MGALEGLDPAASVQRLAAAFPTAAATGTLFWPAANLITFRLPPARRVAFLGACAGRGARGVPAVCALAARMPAVPASPPRAHPALHPHCPRTPPVAARRRGHRLELGLELLEQPRCGAVTSGGEGSVRVRMQLRRRARAAAGCRGATRGTAAAPVRTGRWRLTHATPFVVQGCSHTLAALHRHTLYDPSVMGAAANAAHA